MTDGFLGMFNMDEEIVRYQPGDTVAGRRSETLVKVNGLRVVLFTLRSGITLHEHTAPGPITIHALRGRFAVNAGGDEREINAGTLISIESGIRHAVHAIEDGAFLLTIAPQGAG